MDFAVGLDVMLGGVFGMLGSMDVMPMREMRVMRGRHVIPIFMVFCGFAVMACSVLMMLSCLGVMMRCFVRHRGILSSVLFDT